MITKRPAMTYEERLRFNGKVIGLPFLAFIGLAIYALVRGPQRLLLPQALIDRLYPYALLPWERSFAEGLSLFQQQFVALALIGTIMQTVVGLPTILPHMPEMKALPDIRRNMGLALIVLLASILMRLFFICEMNGVFFNSGHDAGRQFIRLISPALVSITSLLAVVYSYCLIIYFKAYKYGA